MGEIVLYLRSVCRSGEIGRHARFRGVCSQGRGGSSPPFGTSTFISSCLARAYVVLGPSPEPRCWYPSRPNSLFLLVFGSRAGPSVSASWPRPSSTTWAKSPLAIPAQVPPPQRSPSEVFHRSTGPRPKNSMAREVRIFSGNTSQTSKLGSLNCTATCKMHLPSKTKTRASLRLTKPRARRRYSRQWICNTSYSDWSSQRRPRIGPPLIMYCRRCGRNGSDSTPWSWQHSAGPVFVVD